MYLLLLEAGITFFFKSEMQDTSNNYMSFFLRSGIQDQGMDCCFYSCCRFGRVWVGLFHDNSFSNSLEKAICAWFISSQPIFTCRKTKYILGLTIYPVGKLDYDLIASVTVLCYP